MDINELLTGMVEAGSSDLHLSAGMPPVMRADGDMVKIDVPPLSAEDIMTMMGAIVSAEEMKRFEQEMELDTSYAIEGVSRFRINIFMQSRGPAAVFRAIPSKVISMKDLNLPPTFENLCHYKKGLILVTGPTGSGKSTTLAAMMDWINENRPEHIITVEDPIEFVYDCKKSLVNQRELGANTKSFNAALKGALREDPDIILVGELRDLETIRLALSAAETGHLVFATLHTSSAPKTINRIIDVFPGDEKGMIRSMLSESLVAVIAQVLLKKKGGGRVAAHEVMICNAALKNLIREDKIAQMTSAIQTGKKEGMYTLAQKLEELIAKGIIDKEEAEPYLKQS